MKTVQGVKGAAPLILVLCLAAIGVPPVKAQLQPKDFDVPDGKIETAAGNRLIVSHIRRTQQMDLGYQRSV